MPIPAAIALLLLLLLLVLLGGGPAGQCRRESAGGAAAGQVDQLVLSVRMIHRDARERADLEYESSPASKAAAISASERSA